MRVQELRPGLWRWTAPHPAWRSGADWPQEVGCVYLETDEATVLVDPLVPAGEEERFWRALDRDVERRGLPVEVVLTAPWHRRSADEVAERYRAGVRLADDAVPRGLEILRVPPAEERQVALFVPAHGALVVAEVLATIDGDLAVYPSPGLTDHAALAPFLEQLTALPVDLVLPAHGEPVIAGAPAALAAAVARFRP
jgi:hypothetical protein